VDPLAEEYVPISAYAYVANNPILLLDIDGREIVNPYNRQSPLYATAQRAIEVLKESNPQVYNTLNNSSVKVNFYMARPAIGGTRGLTVVSFNREEGNSRLIAEPLGRGENVFSATFSLATYSSQYHKSSDGMPSNFQGLTPSEAEEYMKDKLSIGNIDIFIDPNQSKEEISETAGHEGGHAAFAISNPFAAWVWDQIGDPSKLGHDRYNPDGKAADNETNRAKNFVKNMSIEDWERIAEIVNNR